VIKKIKEIFKYSFTGIFLSWYIVIRKYGTIKSAKKRGDDGGMDRENRPSP
jgi:alkylated DNA nucleotide flippase Atl1